MVLSIISQKGGVGKSTLASCLAVAAAGRHGLSTILIDADPQGSTMAWREIRGDAGIHVPAMALTKPTLHADVVGLTQDLIIIDSGGRDSKLARSAMAASDVVIVPVLPSIYDVLSTGDTLDAIQELQTMKPDLQVLLVINQVIDNRSRMLREALESLQELAPDIQIATTHIPRREIFKRCAAEGLGISELAPGSLECDAIDSLLVEALKIGGHHGF